MAQEFNFGCPEDTLVLPGNEAVLSEPLEDDLEVLEVLLPLVGEHEDVVHVTHAEGQVTEDVIHEALKGGPSIFEAEAGVVECVRPERHNDGRLWYVLGMHWDLKVALHQFAEDGGPVEERGNISDVGQWIVVGLGDVIEVPVITAGPDGAVLLNHYMLGRGPRAGGLLTEPLLLHFRLGARRQNRA